MRIVGRYLNPDLDLDPVFLKRQLLCLRSPRLCLLRMRLPGLGQLLCLLQMPLPGLGQLLCLLQMPLPGLGQLLCLL